MVSRKFIFYFLNGMYLVLRFLNSSQFICSMTTLQCVTHIPKRHRLKCVLHRHPLRQGGLALNKYRKTFKYCEYFKVFRRFEQLFGIFINNSLFFFSMIYEFKNILSKTIYVAEELRNLKSKNDQISPDKLIRSQKHFSKREMPLFKLRHVYLSTIICTLSIIKFMSNFRERVLCSAYATFA